uniref:Uncharacterized protein n=1 Tax=Arundo donax TaxID=35708 RepID=A0A0A9EZE0_ARUDO
MIPYTLLVGTTFLSNICRKRLSISCTFPAPPNALRSIWYVLSVGLMPYLNISW